MKILTTLLLLIPLCISCNKSYRDQDGNPFSSVIIGDQEWMAENLNAATFRNGDPIMEAASDAEWEIAGENGIPAWCYFNNSDEIDIRQGKIYNWYAVADPRGLAPEGWHVPSDREWRVLSMELGMSGEDADKMHERGSDEGNKLKDPTDPRWNLKDSAGFHFTGFNALAAGGRWGNGRSDFFGGAAFFWTTSETSTGGAWALGIHSLPFLNRCDDPKGYGMSVRCIKDRNTQVDPAVSGIVIDTVYIDGIPFRYVVHGKGEPIVVIGSSVYYPAAFSDELKQKFRMFFIDSRHFVPAYDPDSAELASINLETWADDLEKIRLELNLGKINLLGQSIHAQIALEYATRFPQSVKRLLLVCGVPYAFGEYAGIQNEYWDRHAGEDRKAAWNALKSTRDSLLPTISAKRYFAADYYLTAPFYWADPGYNASFLLKDLETSPKAFAKLAGSIPSKNEIVARLRNLKMPSLLILGKLDFAIPHTAWEEIIKDTQLDYRLMDNASHNPFTEASTAKEFNELVIQWIAGK